MSSKHTGGKPLHVFHKYVVTKREILVNKSNCLAICKACIQIKGWEWSLHNATQLKISNTVPSIGKHLINCENFATINPDKLELVNSHLEAMKQKRIKSRLNNSIEVDVDADADVDVDANCMYFILSLD